SVFCSLMYTATTWLYTLSLHDALPIFRHGILLAFATHAPADRHAQDRPLLRPATRHRAGGRRGRQGDHRPGARPVDGRGGRGRRDRKSTRLNSSHVKISYAVFCLKKKK